MDAGVISVGPGDVAAGGDSVGLDAARAGHADGGEHALAQQKAKGAIGAAVASHDVASRVDSRCDRGHSARDINSGEHTPAQQKAMRTGGPNTGIKTYYVAAIVDPQDAS